VREEFLATLRAARRAAREKRAAEQRAAQQRAQQRVAQQELAAQQERAQRPRAPEDFSDWLKDGSPLTFDVAFHLSTKLPTGEVVHETIRAHKAFLAKASPVFKKILFDQEVESGANNASVVSDITVVEENSGEGQNGVDAFKIILNSIYGKMIDMESIDSIHLLAHVAR
jgi:regulator of protease activity HflC (stomatin/prohibitin superfamily)